MEVDLIDKICKLETADLRQIVLGLCLEPKNKEAVAKHIKLLSKEAGASKKQPKPQCPQNSNQEDSDDEDDKSKHHARRGSFVRTTPYTRQKCENCEFWFTAIDNADKACNFHPGSLFLDPTALVWQSLDDGSVPNDWENEYGRKLFPHGFRWSCCGGLNPNSSPCVAQYHVARPHDTYAV